MTSSFLLLAGLTVVVALALLLWPLLRQPGGSAINAQAADLRRRLETLKQAHNDGLIDDADLESRRQQLSTQLLELVDQPGALPSRSNAAKVTAVLLALIVPPATLGVYKLIGEPRALSFTADARPSATGPGPSTQPGQDAPDLAAAADKLRERLDADPEDIEGWLLLARTYRELANFAEARDAYKRVLDSRPEDLEVTVEYAESLGLASNPRSLLGEPARLLDQVLSQDPQNQRALWLAGFARTQGGEYQQALDLWEPLLAIMSDPQARDALSGQINIARAQLGMDPLPETSLAAVAAMQGSASVDTSAAGASASGGIDVEISLDPQLAAKAGPADTLFVFAKAESGPPMPLAVQRLSAAALPLKIRLDDSMGMVEGMVLSKFPRIKVEARISRSGNAQAQAGDLQGSSGGLDNPTSGPIQVVIDQEL
ncbi:MAG: c-type cytochrome biogenesis protein CcmI [Xanthomonadales bacterium]|nr:c-type cytochrome biogenesis protein CcmI [Xanthomonadales bacterium]